MIRKLTITAVFMMFLISVVTAAGPVLAEDDVIRVGVPTTLTIFQGDEMLKAVTMAVEEINAAGGVKVGGKKMKIQLFSADLRDALPGVPVADALMGIEKMILDHKVHALLVGPVRSEALLPAMDVVAEHKVPLIGTVAMTPASEAKVKENPEKYKYIFRAGLNARYLVGYVLGSLNHLNKEFGYNKLFCMVQDVMWARGTAKAVSERMSAAGWEVLGTEAYPTGASDFSSGLIKAKNNGAQAILIMFDMATSSILVKQWGGMKVPGLLLGNISPMAGPDAWTTYEGKIAGTINTVMESGNMPIPKIPASVAFYENYEKKYGHKIQAPHGPSASYDAVYILAEAIERAGTLDGDALADAIKQTDHQGPMGRVRFDEGNQAVFGNDPAETALGCMFQWREGGKRVVVFPESVAEDKIQLPEWMK